MEQFAIPGAGGILEKEIEGEKHILLQDRIKENAPLEAGLIEIPAGKIRAFENIYDCLRREIKEETGLDMVSIDGEDRAQIVEANGYRVLSYTPFHSSQNLTGSYPIMVQTFLCQVQGRLLQETNETGNLRWVSLGSLETLLKREEGRFYPMHISALNKYIMMNNH